jgi:hypothetical protein
MMKRIAAFAAVVGLGLVAANASAVAAPDPAARPASSRSCFLASQVNGWSTDRDDVVYLEVGVKDIYRAELFSHCPDLDAAVSIGVRTRGGGISICDGLDVDLVVPSTIGPQTCHLTRLRKLSTEEVTALKGSRKK